MAEAEAHPMAEAEAQENHDGSVTLQESPEHRHQTATIILAELANALVPATSSHPIIPEAQPEQSVLTNQRRAELDIAETLAQSLRGLGTECFGEAHDAEITGRYALPANPTHSTVARFELRERDAMQKYRNMCDEIMEVVNRMRTGIDEIAMARYCLRILKAKMARIASAERGAAEARVRARQEIQRARVAATAARYAPY